MLIGTSLDLAHGDDGGGGDGDRDNGHDEQGGVAGGLLVGQDVDEQGDVHGHVHAVGGGQEDAEDVEGRQGGHQGSG